MKSDLPAREGRFQIEALLGRGAMGVVYKAWDPAINRYVAIKKVNQSLLEDQERAAYLARFRNEARLCGLCDHPNIVTLYDVTGGENDPSIILQYVDGLGLNKALPRGEKLPVSEVVPIALQVLAALDYAHGLGIVHRDVKPANIILTYQGRLKITDFGVSYRALTSEPDQALLIGTPNYMSPEQCSGRQVDARSDLFSLGSILYELLSGQKAFEGREYTDTVFKILNTDPEPLGALRPDIPEALVRVVERVLAKDPADRFSEAAEFAFALRRAVPGFDLTSPLPLPVSPPEPVPVATPEKRVETSVPSTPSVPEPQEEDDRTIIVTDDGDLGVPEHPSIEPEWMESVDTYLQGLYGPLARVELRNACKNVSTKGELLASLVSDVTVREQLFARFLTDDSSKGETSVIERPIVTPSEERKADHAAPIPAPVPPPQEPEPEPQEPQSRALTDDDVSVVGAALADVLGPVAQPLIRRASLRARDFASFVSLCETFIHHQGDLERFRRILATSSRSS
ncbi:serine/threonine-protein kinase [Acetobacter sp.]|jgi:serine/threonine-protein kinase|uniref:serine/threonine-protein kinase n=1 Tax=Acetobacter sp. TaxID=440 RepID=UPI0025BDF487|nr:serine/threonine-protein kinase [Acetobacter sp.]MCH4092644.1 serine/threonine protein kinase [Acetobacter sp.]MCI1299778.1 serine/threonine protein kinase [Acetobacter sp.]MCI1315342.1 serine/threonine protein kinase [Acetobacter sp.]